MLPVFVCACFGCSLLLRLQIADCSSQLADCKFEFCEFAVCLRIASKNAFLLNYSRLRQAALFDIKSAAKSELFSSKFLSFDLHSNFNSNSNCVRICKFASCELRSNSDRVCVSLINLCVCCSDGATCGATELFVRLRVRCSERALQQRKSREQKFAQTKRAELQRRTLGFIGKLLAPSLRVRNSIRVNLLSLRRSSLERRFARRSRHAANVRCNEQNSKRRSTSKRKQRKRTEKESSKLESQFTQNAKGANLRSKSVSFFLCFAQFC